MGIWFRVPALSPHMTFATAAQARAAMKAAGVTGQIVRYVETPSGVVARPVR